MADTPDTYSSRRSVRSAALRATAAMAAMAPGSDPGSDPETPSLSAVRSRGWYSGTESHAGTPAGSSTRSRGQNLVAESPAGTPAASSSGPSSVTPSTKASGLSSVTPSAKASTIKRGWFIPLKDCPSNIDLAGSKDGPGFWAGPGCKKEVPDTHPVRVAVDCGLKGAKNHSGLRTPADFELFVDWFMRYPNKLRPANQPSCLYEVINDKYITPTRLALDLDREFWPDELAGGDATLQEARTRTISAVLHHAQELLRCLSRDPGLKLQPGVNCQISESRYDVKQKNKLSAHAVFYLTTDCNWALCEQFAILLVARMSKLSEKDPHRRLLFKADNTCIVDLKIYDKGRQLRLLRNCKMSCPAPLVPICGSSPRVMDQLARFFPDLQPDNAQPFPLYPEELSTVLADDAAACRERGGENGGASGGGERGDQAAGGGGRVRARLTRSMQPAAGGGARQPPLFTPEELSAVRHCLCSSADLAAQLGVSTVQFSHEYTSENGRSCRFFVDSNTQPKCPVKGSQHSSNNIFVHYDHIGRTCVVGCFSQDCQGKLQRGDAVAAHPFRIELADTTASLTSAADAIHAGSLHARRPVIPWREVYNEPSMRPYPLDERLAVICAPMGCGKTKASVQYLQKLLQAAVAADRQPRVAVITFRRSLAYKLAKDYSDMQAAQPSDGDDDTMRSVLVHSRGPWREALKIAPIHGPGPIWGWSPVEWKGRQWLLELGNLLA